MSALSSTPIPNMDCSFAGKSLIRTENSVRFRMVAISSAFTSPTKNREAASSSLSTLSLKLAPMSFYQVLGISMEATGDEIKSAYWRQARTFHPDVVTADQKNSSAEEFIKIHAAYSTLSDPDKRADYDRRIFSRRRRSYVSYSTESPTIRRYSGYSGRNWETDQCW